MDTRAVLNTLLVRWHRWSADPVASSDTAMADFDRIVGHLKPYLIAALIVEARNQACGVAVWRSVRAGGKKTLWEARGKLLRELAADQLRWFGAVDVVQFNTRGNRIGESNPNAAAPDRDVALCVQLREQINPDTGRPRYSLGQLALRFRVSKATVQAWCDGRRRGQAAARVARLKELT